MHIPALARPLVVAALTSLLIALVTAILSPASGQQPAQAIQGARISGTVVDRENGRPVPSAQILIAGLPGGTESDLDGRFRTQVVSAGTYSLRVRRIGYQPTQLDGVAVQGGQSTVITVALQTAAQTLGAVEVTVERLTSATSDGGLLAQRKAAPAISDGISAEAMSRSPDSDAADAIVRVTGVSVLDDKFVIVRGLAERYSNTQLNGVELPSPEPLKKIVPLDIFPASLLESIVTTKTATPDKPADFAGGSVEVRTKEFPENRVIGLSISQEWNSRTTFQEFSHAPLRGGALLGFGGSSRAMPREPRTGGPPDELERFAESIRGVWTPAARRAMPNLGFGFNFGDQLGERVPLGYALALTYSAKTEYLPDRFYQFLPNVDEATAAKGFVAKESQSVVDWGGILNVSVRLGQSTKLGFKNLYTRNAEEQIAVRDGFNIERTPEEQRIYQVTYVTRQLFQTQLTGDHLLGRLWNSRLEWKATMADAERDEPDNRSVTYAPNVDRGGFSQATNSPHFLWFRFLDDRVYTGNLDWSFPIRLGRETDALLKFGGLYRTKRRTFDAALYAYYSAAEFGGDPALALPPEQAFAPENVGADQSALIALRRQDAVALPYEADDNLGAAYAMLDLPVLSKLRIVGGVRVEDWRLDLRTGLRAGVSDTATKRDSRDVLGSANLTLALSDRMNLRLAGYQTLTRPDPRELANDYYIAVSGECANQGRSDLRRTLISNADVRWELYPAATEIVAVSAFYKRFKDPIVEIVTLPNAQNCLVVPVNAESATNYGAELEARKGLDWVPYFPSGFAVGLNVTVVQSEARLGASLNNDTRPLAGQSPYLVNASLLYQSHGGRFDASVLVNAFGDRVTRYGATFIADSTFVQVPHVQERSRVTVDAQAQMRLGGHVTLSLAGKNLTDEPQEFFQESATRRVRAAYARSGRSVKMRIGYAF